MQGCFGNPFVNDTSLRPRPLPSLHMRTRYSALSTRTSTALSTAHDLNPRQRRALFATPSSNLEDLELHVIFQVYEERELLQNDNKQFVF